jgi:hypothetical protein
LAPLIRGVFLPEEGEVWAKPDASQQEFRLIVHYAVAQGLRKAKEAAERYRADPSTDFHRLVSDWTGLDRSTTAKSTNFAKAYGMGVRAFAAKIGKSEAEARAIFAKYDRELPFVKQLAARCKYVADRQGYIKLYDGARRHWEAWEAPAIAWTKGMGPSSCCSLGSWRSRSSTVIRFRSRSRSLEAVARVRRGSPARPAGPIGCPAIVAQEPGERPAGSDWTAKRAGPALARSLASPCGLAARNSRIAEPPPIVSQCGTIGGARQEATAP